MVRRKSSWSRSRFSATTSCGVMWVTPDSGSTVCGRPAASRAEDRRRVCATTTLSSASPWMISSGRGRAAGACRRAASCGVGLGLLVGVAEVALGVGGVVEPPVGDRRAGDRRVEDVGPAQHRERREVAAEGPAADRRPGARSSVGVRLGGRLQRVDLVVERRPSRGRAATARSQRGPRPGVPRPSATTTAKPWSASHCDSRYASCAASTRWPCGPPYGSISTGSGAVPARGPRGQQHGGARASRSPAATAG